MIFKRGRKRGSDSAVDESTEESTDEPSLDELDDEATEAESETSTEELEGEDRESADLEGAELAALDELDWRTSGPYDIGEVSDIESTEESPRIDLGSLILTAVSGSELRLQVAEETGEIASAMLVIETIVEPPASANQKPQAYSSALELGAYAAPRSGGLWAELRDEIAHNATEAGGTASLGEGPFGIELEAAHSGDHARRRGGISTLSNVGRRRSALAAARHRVRPGGHRRRRRLTDCG